MERVFNIISIDGKTLSDRPRTFTIGLALNGNPYGVGFGGCHGWGANIEALERGQIKVESVHVTQAQPQGACTPEQQRAEDEFLDVLKQGAVRWRMEEQTLVLESNARTIRMAEGPFTDRSIPPAIRQALWREELHHPHRTRSKRYSKGTVCSAPLARIAASPRAKIICITLTGRSMPITCSATR